MAIHIPGTNINIGKKKGGDKKAVLKEAYRRVLSSGSDQSKVAWPEMPEGDANWYDPNNETLRRASAAGYMHDAERQVGEAPNFKLNFDMPDSATGKTAERAFSSSEGLVNMPSEIKGYMSKPQYLALTLAHEVAHNKDWVKNHPKVGHNKETFRPLEKAASQAAMLEPFYGPGNDVGVGGKNEYADAYLQTGPWKDRYSLSTNQMDPTRQVYFVDPKQLARALIQHRNLQRQGPVNMGGFANLAGPLRGNQI